MNIKERVHPTSKQHIINKLKESSNLYHKLETETSKLDIQIFKYYFCISSVLCTQTACEYMHSMETLEVLKNRTKDNVW